MTTSNRTRNVSGAILEATAVPWHHTINRYSDKRWRYQVPCPAGHDTHTFGFDDLATWPRLTRCDGHIYLHPKCALTLCQDLIKDALMASGLGRTPYAGQVGRQRDGLA